MVLRDLEDTINGFFIGYGSYYLLIYILVSAEEGDVTGVFIFFSKKSPAAKATGEVQINDHELFRLLILNQAKVQKRHFFHFIVIEMVLIRPDLFQDREGFVDFVLCQPADGQVILGFVLEIVGACLCVCRQHLFKVFDGFVVFL